jgi:SAM-dependent methyltransferase
LQIYNEPLSDVDAYLAKNGALTIEDKRPEYERLLRYTGKYHTITPLTRMLEIGTGVGAVPILAKLNGLNMKGLEISQQLIDHAKVLGRSVGVEPDIELENIETAELGEGCYDVIICSNVFEHVEYWYEGVAKVYRALKPGGAMFFESTNKWTIKSGEYPPMRFYGYLPNWARYRFRKWIHGPDIMKLGIDFHQFRDSGLRKAFRKIGFTQIHDILDIVDAKWYPGSLKRKIIRLSQRIWLFRKLFLFFFPSTTFVVVK